MPETKGELDGGEYFGPQWGTDTIGSFDLWMHIDGYNFNYITKVAYGANGYIGAFVYTGLQSPYPMGSVEVDTDGDGTLETIALDPRGLGNGNTDIYQEPRIITTMQEITPQICAATLRWDTKVGSVAGILSSKGTTYWSSQKGNDAAKLNLGTYSLKDTRDGKSYLVRRLADGNCWMVEDLDLDLVAVAGGTIKLTNENTDLNSKTSWKPDSSTIASSFAGATTARFYENDLKYVLADNSGTATDSTWTFAYGSLYVGDYYNWYAATAESGTQEMISNENAKDSICPKGWQLPVSSNSSDAKDWKNLIIGAYGLIEKDGAQSGTTATEKMRSLPISIILSGNMNGNSGDRGLDNVYGAFWASTAHVSMPERATHLGFYDNRVWTHDETLKTNGFPIRCVARD